jgi:hypothetical protein
MNFFGNINNVASLKVNFKEVSLNEIESMGPGLSPVEGCNPNISNITNYLKNYVSNMSSMQTAQSKRVTYEVAGLPLVNYDMSNGLIQFSVRVGSQGVRSYLTFSDMKDRYIGPSDAFLEFSFRENNRTYPLVRSMVNPSGNKNLIANSAEETIIR